MASASQDRMSIQFAAADREARHGIEGIVLEDDCDTTGSQDPPHLIRERRALLAGNVVQHTNREREVDAAVGERKRLPVKRRVSHGWIRGACELHTLLRDVDAVKLADVVGELGVGQPDAATHVEHSLVARPPEQRGAQREEVLNLARGDVGVIDVRECDGTLHIVLVNGSALVERRHQ